MYRKFFAHLVIFSVPFLLYAGFIIATDPFNLFGVEAVVPRAVKEANATPLNYALWKTVDFKAHARANILLGDSRMGLLEPEDLQRVYGQSFYNFSLGAGTLEEIINLFWYASGVSRLDTVIIGLNFELYNQANRRDRIEGALSIQRNPLLYFTCTDVPEAAVECLRAVSAGHNESIEKPPMTSEEFWRYQLDQTATRYYATYVHPSEYLKKLSEISAYCRTNGITLIFVNFPVHRDLQQVVTAFGLQAEYQEMLCNISRFAPLIDLNFENDVTCNRELFGDPFHLTHDSFRNHYLSWIAGPMNRFDTTLSRVYVGGRRVL